MKKYYPLLLIFFIGWQTVHSQVINTIVGDTIRGYNGDNIHATAAHLKEPSFMAVDSRGNMYISDDSNFRIRKVNPAGIITTFAGNGGCYYGGYGGAATATSIRPLGIAVDKYDNVYFSDQYCSCVRKVSPAGIITLVAGSPDTTGAYGSAPYGDGGPATAASFKWPACLVVDSSGNVYIEDAGNALIRKVDASSGIISTFAGGGTSVVDGPATAMQLDIPTGIAIDAEQNIYTIGQQLGQVQRIDMHGMLTTITGSRTYTARADTDGVPAAAANFPYSGGIAVDGSGNLYVVDALHFKIVEITPSLDIFHVAGNGHYGYTGDGGPATAAELADINGIAADNAGNILVGDYARSTIRKVSMPAAGVKQQASNNALHIWPNPAHGTFSVLAASGFPSVVHITVINTVGQKMKELDVAANTELEVKIDVSPGNYYIMANINGACIAQPIVLLDR